MVSSAASHWPATAAAPSGSPAAMQAFSAARSLPRDSRCSQVPQSAAAEGFLWRERERSRRRPEDVERARPWLPGHDAAGAEPEAPWLWGQEVACAASDAVGCDWLCHAARPCVQLFAVESQPCAALDGGAAAWSPHDQAQPQEAVV